jgi:hypothetical protein
MRKYTTLIMAALALAIMAITSCKKAGNAAQFTYDCTDLSTITTNATLPAGIYTIGCSIEVSQGATLTISPGATLIFTQSAYLMVDAGASLTAAGTAAAPIVIKGSQALPGYWQGIIINSVSLNNVFSYCTISDGGSNTGNGSYNADVTIVGGTASFTNCTINSSSDAGIFIASSNSNTAYFNSFSNNTLTTNGSYPIVTRLRAAGTIGTGNSFAGNTNNYIGILSSTVSSNVTLSAQPVPYLFLQTGSDAGVTMNGALTISPGANIVMGSGMSLLVSGAGSMYAVGTASSPITFSGLQATAGYWASVLINTQSTQNNFQYCNFSYGGGAPVNAIEIYASNVGMLSTYMYLPVTRSINVTNCTFSNSGSSGIYVSATDGPPTVPPTYNSNIITANTFNTCNPNVQQ